MMTPRPAKDAMRHGALDRLRFIDARLFWEARINRADLIEAFAISQAQAALDFRAYLELSGNGVVYDTRAKSYVTTDAYEPAFPQPDGRQDLSKFAAAGDPLTTTLPRLERPLNAGIAARVRRAARDAERLLIDYQSFTRPGASRRWIAPVRLINDGERWHARAWCFERCAWRDFVLARILAVRAEEPAGDLPVDVDWEDMVEVRLLPASHLSPSQKASVEREFAMTDGCLVVRLPRAMLIYAKQRWGLDRPGARLEASTPTESPHSIYDGP
ncbi:MAG: WYL domain-containing protein [Alphaproteobacteria bacterium]|nr:WYL domain-containing protein [Alphaproteobacteria bacterium]